MQSPTKTKANWWLVVLANAMQVSMSSCWNTHNANQNQISFGIWNFGKTAIPGSLRITTRQGEWASPHATPATIPCYDVGMERRFQFGLKNLLWAMTWLSICGGAF